MKGAASWVANSNSTLIDQLLEATGEEENSRKRGERRQTR